MTDLAFIDTETTGVHPGRRAWEIAIIRRKPSGDEDVWLIQVEDVDLSNADPFGLKVGGFYDRHVRYTDAPVPAKVLTEEGAAYMVEEYTRGAHLVGAVPNFDAEVFDAMLRRHKLIPAWHYHLIDVENLAVGYLAGLAGHGHSEVTCGPLCGKGGAEPAALPWKSDDLSRACGVEPPSEDQRHTALGDAKWAMRLYDAIVGRSS